MPKILELRVINDETWAKLPSPETCNGVYILSQMEMVDIKCKAIMDFLFDLGNEYIDETYPLQTGKEAKSKQ